MGEKIQITTPLVEMDGDEMTRVLWQWIKDILLTPYVDLKTEYYDLGLEYREKTKDQVTIDSANATKKYGVEPRHIDINVCGDEVELNYDLGERPFHRIRRITGYLGGTLDRFNNAKRAEERDRVKHSISLQ